MGKKINEKAFIKKLIVAFPILKDDVLDEDYLGLFSLQMGCFTRFTQQAINSGDWALVKKCFFFIDEIFDEANEYILNSIHVTYLGKLEIKQDLFLKEIMSDRLIQALNDITNAYKAPHSRKVTDFLKSL